MAEVARSKDTKAPGLRPDLRAYLAADNALKLSQQARDKAFRNAFPRGSEIYWMHGSRWPQRGIVTLHGYGDRLKVRNADTHREVWVNGYDIRLFEEGRS